MTLDIGGDRILLETRSNIYRLDVYLPFNIVQDEVGAQFNRTTKVCIDKYFNAFKFALYHDT